MAIGGSEASIVLVDLVSAAARTLVLAAIAGLSLTALRVKGTLLRLFTWTAVLYAGLSMPLLGGMAPSIQIPVPFGLSRPVDAIDQVKGTVTPVVSSAHPITSHAVQSTAATDSNPSLEVTQRNDKVGRSSRMARALASIRWSAVAACIYLAIALFLLVKLVIGIAFARRLARSSTPIDDPRVSSRRLASRSNRLLFPPIRESQSASVPLTIGVLTHAIILPTSWREWDDDKLVGVLTHEMSHVARRDCLSQYLSLLHRAIFWFSPFAWWLNRHIIDLAEQASDEEVLSRGADQNRYARTLLAFLQTVQATPGRVRWQGVSMASSGRAERRLEKVLSWRGGKKMGTKKSALITVVALAISVSFLLAASRPVTVSQSRHKATGAQDQATPVTAEKPIPPPPAVEASPASAHEPPSPSAILSSAAPAEPDGPGTPMVAQQTESGTHHHHFSYRNGNDDEQRFVIVSGKTAALTMSGSGEDARHAEKLKQRIPGDFIWFQRDERSYIIRDQATVDRARQFWAPQEELGRKQEALGKQQEALGKQQQELGARMQAVRVKVPDLTAELDKLKAELKQLGPDATTAQIGRIQSEIGHLQSKIGEIQSHAGDEQGKLGEEMGALGEKQGELGRQQGELGRQQGELAEKASRDMKELLDDAIKNGVAQPESPEPGGASL
jgi:beta-lactamase regulating signal transducer with metallopeptidase domain